MSIIPQLTATASGTVLELRPSGSWIAVNAQTLEALVGRVTAQLDRSTAVRLDMTGVGELDMLGAWLLEKISRRATFAGHPSDVVGVAGNYAGLIEEVRQVNQHNPVPPPVPNPVLLKLSEVGGAAIDATQI